MSIDPLLVTRVVLGRRLTLARIEHVVPSLAIIRWNIPPFSERVSHPPVIQGRVLVDVRFESNPRIPEFDEAATNYDPRPTLWPFPQPLLELPALFVPDELWMDAWVELIDRDGAIVMSVDDVPPERQKAAIDRAITRPPPHVPQSAAPQPRPLPNVGEERLAELRRMFRDE